MTVTQGEKIYNTILTMGTHTHIHTYTHITRVRQQLLRILLIA